MQKYYKLKDQRFLSTPSARRATQDQFITFGVEGISIHALREEGDRNAKGQQTVHFIFLSTPSARRATRVPNVFVELAKFLSTPSARRATRSVAQWSRYSQYFYPRPP